MLFFWLAAGIISLLIVSFNCFTIGFDKWGAYYITPVIAFMMFLFKRWMMKRMSKHIEFLDSTRETKNPAQNTKSNTSN